MTVHADAEESSEARADAVRALEAEFGDLIGRFRRYILDNAQRVSPGLLPGAYKVLSTIARCEGVTVSNLAERMMIDKGQVSRTVRELEHLGFIARQPDPDDGRSALLSVTPLALERLALARRPLEGIFLDNIQSWSVDDIRNLTRLLSELAGGAQPEDAPPAG